MSNDTASIGTPFGTGQSYGSEAQKLSDQCLGSERSTGNDQSCLKTAISLTGPETVRVRHAHRRILRTAAAV